MACPGRRTWKPHGPSDAVRGLAACPPPSLVEGGLLHRSGRAEESLARDGARRGQAVARGFGRLCLATGRTGATTVAATMMVAHARGHRGLCHRRHRRRASPAPRTSFDISADLHELARTPVTWSRRAPRRSSICPRRSNCWRRSACRVAIGQDDVFPAFWSRESGCARRCGPTAAQAEAVAEGVTGKAVTPWLLARLAALTEGRTLDANRALIVDNARLATRIAAELCRPF
jgi:pseudouridine-5'-phosphate glycosidase